MILYTGNNTRYTPKPDNNNNPNANRPLDTPMQIPLRINPTTVLIQHNKFPVIPSLIPRPALLNTLKPPTNSLHTYNFPPRLNNSLNIRNIPTISKAGIHP
mmetsp:Transcript_36509/g.6532  ORF Transcript_36509/g.6532 Transcript_36509/m.6532 type:complete len:101 (+) Transcript_36509:649-951(+)